MIMNQEHTSLLIIANLEFTPDSSPSSQSDLSHPIILCSLPPASIPPHQSFSMNQLSAWGQLLSLALVFILLMNTQDSDLL